MALHWHDRHPWASIITQLGSHVLKSKGEHPPAPGTLVVPVVLLVVEGACVVTVQVQDMQPCASITTHLGSHVLKSKVGHPPAPATPVTAPDVLDCPPEGAMVAAQLQDRHPLSSMTTQFGSQVLKSKEGQPPAPGTLVTAPDVVLD